MDYKKLALAKKLANKKLANKQLANKKLANAKLVPLRLPENADENGDVRITHDLDRLLAKAHKVKVARKSSRQNKNRRLLDLEVVDDDDDIVESDDDVEDDDDDNYIWCDCEGCALYRRMISPSSIRLPEMP
jgi:hypothetical protein